MDDLLPPMGTGNFCLSVVLTGRISRWKDYRGGLRPHTPSSNSDRFLWAVLNWTTKTGDDRGTILLARQPLKDCVQTRHWPRENNPDRPALTSDQYAKLLEAAPSFDWRFDVAVILAHETGHRIGSIRRLQWSDLEAREGWFRWSEEADKVRWEHWTPRTDEAARAIRIAERQGREADDPSVWLLPSPADASRPCSRNIM